MISSFQARQLFSSPLLIGQIDDQVLNSDLEQRILARRSDDPGVQRSNRGGWHSDLNLMKWGGDGAQRLLDEIVELAGQNTASVAGELQAKWAVEAWANVNSDGAANARHVHGGCYWSAVYYVRVDQGEGGELVLHDPRMPTLAMHAPYLRFKNMGGERQVRIKPEAGRLLIFPSWLPHAVEPWSGDGLRISIAINLSVLPKSLAKATSQPPARSASPRPTKKPSKEE